MKRYFLIVLFLLTGAAIAAPHIEAQDSSYGIMGSTAGQLREQMNLFRYQATNGKYDADTQWNIDWEYDYLKHENSCELKNFQVNLKIIYHLPQWLNAQSADAHLREKWERYMENLRIHENGHARNSEKAAWEIEEMLNNLAPMASCGLLKEVVDQRAHQILAEHNVWDVEYDKATNHGMNQGAVFP